MKHKPKSATIEIVIDWTNEKSIAKGEHEKAYLENLGYKLIGSRICNTATLIYSK